MIGKEKFIEIIESYFDTDKYIDQLNDFLNINIFENPICNAYYKMFYNWLNASFTKAGIEWVDWWIFDREPNSSKPQAWNADNTPIPTETLEDLWNLIKEYRI